MIWNITSQRQSRGHRSCPHRHSHGNQAHRSHLVRDLVAAQQGRLLLERLPAYAPELNPVECIWGYWKHHELANLCAKNLSEPSVYARHVLRRMRRRPVLVRAFWKQAELFV